MDANKVNPEYFKNFVFGAEDSLVSTVGVLFGVASANYDKNFIIVTGLVVIAVEALSMGAGAYLTETSTHELKSAADHKDKPITDGIIMFLSYFTFGFLPLLPYILMDNENAKYVSLIIALGMLFILGYWPNKKLRGGLRMTVVAGMAVLIGFIIGNFADSLL